MHRSSILLFALVLPLYTLRAQDDPLDKPAPAPPEPFPAAYKNDEILPDGVSPDGKYGLIFPKRDLARDMDHPKLFLTALKPFRVLTEIPVRDGDLWHGHSSHSVAWAKDSSAVVMIENGKWGPDRVFVVPVYDGRAGKVADLTASIETLVRHSYKDSKAVRFNDYYEFVFESEYNAPSRGEAKTINEQWLPNEPGKVAVRCFCTNDPKGVEKILWTVRFDGVWDIAQDHFAQQKVTRLPSSRP